MDKFAVFAFLLLASPAAAASRYFVGDSVTYRYSGSYRGVKPPIFLRETVVAKDGDKLDILVEFKSGKDKRRWKQVVIDTDENRKANKVQKLVEVSDDGAETVLPNKDNADLMRLYEGTYLTPQGKPELVSVMDSEKDFCGKKWPVRTKTEQIIWEKRQVALETHESSEFVWTNAGSIGTDATGEVVYRAAVIECRRPPEATPPPVKRVIP